MVMSAAPQLTLCMIVRDEATRLPACLHSVRGLADEIVIVDTGSVDTTREVALAAGAVVVDRPWDGDFSAARNAGLTVATGRWVLVLDADETLTREGHEAIKAIVAGKADHACQLVQRNLLPGGVGHVSVQTVRLFPRHARVRFERPIHEQVNTSLEREGIAIHETAIAFCHTGYMDASAMPAKTRRNRAIIERALAREPEGDPNLRFFHAATFFDTGDYPRAAQEYLTCVEQCGGRRPKLESAARLKAAESYILAGLPAQAEPLLPKNPGTEVHPLACELRAKLCAGAQRRDEARRWRECLLAVPDVAHLPPVALGPMKLRALSALAEEWAARGRKDRAVKLLRLSMEAVQGTVDPASPDLARVYAIA